MITSPTHALLAGEVAGVLARHYADVELELDERGDYTGRVLLPRPDGLWAVSVERIDEVPA